MQIKFETEERTGGKQYAVRYEAEAEVKEGFSDLLLDLVSALGAFYWPKYHSTLRENVRFTEVRRSTSRGTSVVEFDEMAERWATLEVIRALGFRVDLAYVSL